MSGLRRFKQKLTTVKRLWQEHKFDSALAEVESLLQDWPGNAYLHVLWANLVELQDHPEHELDEAKQALQQAIELDETSPAAHIELGYFLDNVKDDPRAACRAHAEGVAAARRLLIDGLIGQAKALRQLGKRAEFLRCVLEVLHLARFASGAKRGRAEEAGTDIIFESPAGHFHALQLKGPYAERIQDLLNGDLADCSA